MKCRSSILAALFFFLTGIPGMIGQDYINHSIGVSATRFNIIDNLDDNLEILYTYRFNDKVQGRVTFKTPIVFAENEILNYWFGVGVSKDLDRINDFTFYYGGDLVFAKARTEFSATVGSESSRSQVGLKLFFGVRLKLWNHLYFSTEPSFNLLYTRLKTGVFSNQAIVLSQNSFDPEIYNLGHLRISLHF